MDLQGPSVQKEMFLLPWSTSSGGGTAGIALLNEATARGFSTVVSSNQAAAYVHVDDAVFISSSSSKALASDKLLKLTVDGLEAVASR